MPTSFSSMPLSHSNTSLTHDSNSSGTLSARRTSAPTTSMNDLPQFMTRSSLSPRHLSLPSLDAQLSDCPVSNPVPSQALHSRHRYAASRRGADYHSRRPSSSHSRSSSRSSRNISRVASLVDTLVASSSSSESDMYHPSSSVSETSTATSPSLSPDESQGSMTSYFSLNYRPASSASSLGGMPSIPDTEDMYSRNFDPEPFSPEKDSWTLRGREDGLKAAGTVAARKPERVMKSIKMRRRRNEKRKGKL